MRQTVMAWMYTGFKVAAWIIYCRLSSIQLQCNLEFHIAWCGHRKLLMPLTNLVVEYNDKAIHAKQNDLST